MKEYPLLVEVDTLLLEIWKLYENSPQRMAVFKQIQDVYRQNPLSMTRASTTRWLSHLKACVRFIERFESLLDTLDALYGEKREPEIFGIRSSMLKNDLVFMMLTDVLKPINLLSLYLQGKCINFTNLSDRVKCTIDDLNNIIQAYQSNDYAELEFHKSHDLSELIIDRTSLARRMRMDHDRLDLTPADFLKYSGIPYIHGLIREVLDAFHSHPTLVAFGYLDPSNLPEDATELADYGDAMITTLTEFYGQLKEEKFQGHLTQVGPDLPHKIATKSELKSFKHQLFILKSKGCLRLHDVYVAFKKDQVLQNCFPRVFTLLYYGTLIPVSTAAVERGFSLMNDLYTVLRSNLNQQNLNALMRTCKEGCNTLSDDDLNTLLENFKAAKNRNMPL